MEGRRQAAIMEGEWDRCKYQYSKTSGPWWHGDTADGLPRTDRWISDRAFAQVCAKWWKAFWNDVRKESQKMHAEDVFKESYSVHE